MKYPTAAEVCHADHFQLARWSRFLPSPGMSRIGFPDLAEACHREGEVLALILNRFAECGGWNPALSKRVG